LAEDPLQINNSLIIEVREELHFLLSFLVQEEHHMQRKNVKEK
jgi:hypothetical protein